MKRTDATVILTGFAHVLAWVVAIFLVFGPVYQGASVTPVAPGGAVSEPARFTQTFIGANGLRVLPFLLWPVALTALALLAALRTNAGQARRKVLLWVLAVLLLGFCAVAIASIGLLYLPAALTLLISAVLGLRGRVAETRTG